MRCRRPGNWSGGIAYVLGEFPSVSETFILREMVALREQGFDILPLATQRPEQAVVHSEAEPFVAAAEYRPSPLSPRSLLAQFAAAFCFPAGYLTALRFVLWQCLRHPLYVRELVSALFAAGYFASLPAGRRARHIHAHFGSYPATVGLLLAEITGRSFSLACHARDVFTGESILLGEKIREAEFCVVCNAYAQERLLRQHRLVTTGRLHLVHHGVDLGVYRFRTEQPVKPPLILTVGRLIEKKGLPILLHAAAILHSRDAEFRLGIVGDGPERENLERLAAGLGLRDITRFYGQLSQEELVPLYYEASVFVLPSVVAASGDRDGLPNVLIEALALGVPAVASNFGAIPELVIHEETGLLAQPGDAESFAEQIERAIYDEELRSYVALNGRHKVDTEFNLQRNTAAIARLLSQTMEEW